MWFHDTSPSRSPTQATAVSGAVHGRQRSAEQHPGDNDNLFIAALQEADLQV